MSLTGQRGVFPQPGSYGRHEGGQFSTLYFHGTKEQVAQQAAVLDAQGYLYQVREGYGFSFLEVYFDNNPANATEAPVDLWEYSSQKAQKDLLGVDVPSGITATLSQNNIAIIKAAINGQPDGTDTSNAYSSSAHPNAPVTTASFADGNPANALTIYKLMQAGFTDGIVQADILRHTQTVSRNYPISLSKLNVGKIYSTATLIAVENPPSWAVTGLPTNIPATFSTINVVYGWYKNKPSITGGAYRKTNLVQEFEYGLWPTAIFGPAL